MTRICVAIIFFLFVIETLFCFLSLLLMDRMMPAVYIMRRYVSFISPCLSTCHPIVYPCNLMKPMS